MRYRTIVADPPWRVEGSQGDGRPWASKGGRRNRETFFPYKTQTLGWIQALDVDGLAERDAHLYLWVTAKFNRLGHGVATAEAWGFECVSEIVWDKINFGLGAPCPGGWSSEGGYNNHACRCADCRTAANEGRKARRLYDLEAAQVYNREYKRQRRAA